MTKYILNSGSAKKYPEKERAFIDEILRDLPKKVRVLYCFFSQARERWETKYCAYQERFSELAGEEHELAFDLAFPDTFEEQVAKSDVVLIQGGDDYLLQLWLKQFDLEEIFKDKVIAASSAGSDALVSYFWTCDWRKCLDGMGIIPVKIIPHFKSEYGKDDPRGEIDWELAKEELKEYGDKQMKVYALKEGEFIVFKK